MKLLLKPMLNPFLLYDMGFKRNVMEAATGSKAFKYERIAFFKLLQKPI
jgi:hypothetical protein